MDEVDVEPVDVRRELIELIETTFRGAPVEAVAPIAHELFQIREVRAVVPVRVGDLTRETRAPESILQVGQDGIGDVDLERNDRILRR